MIHTGWIDAPTVTSNTTYIQLHVVPSQTIHLTEGQYQYVLATKDDSVSERVRELVEKGIEVEDE